MGKECSDNRALHQSWRSSLDFNRSTKLPPGERVSTEFTPEQPGE